MKSLFKPLHLFLKEDFPYRFRFPGRKSQVANPADNDIATIANTALEEIVSPRISQFREHLYEEYPDVEGEVDGNTIGIAY